MDFLFPLGIGLTAIVGLILCAKREVPWAWYLLALTSIFLLEYKLETLTQEDHNKNLKLNVSRQVNSITARLIGEINGNLSLVHGLAAHIASQPDIDQAGFERFAKAVFLQDPLLINLAAAPDMVIKMIHPMKGNEAALGLSYLENDLQRAAALRVKQGGGMVVAGPVNLIQGGTAFIGRVPVYTHDSSDPDAFWGLVSAPIDAHKLYAAAGMFDGSLTINIALQGADGLGADGDVFFGDGAIFSDPHAIQATIPVGSGSWILAANPVGGWQQIPARVWIIRAVTIALALGCLLVLRSRYRQIRNNQRYEAKIRENKQLLEDAGKLALIGGWKLHVNGELSHLSDQSTSIFGLPDDDEIPTLETVLNLFDNAQANQLKYYLQEAVTSGRQFDTELHIDEGDDVRWVRIIGNPVHHLGHITEVVGAVQDITEKKKFTEMIQRQATYDIITGLPNRFLFENRLSKTIAKADRDGTRFAILFIDLDNFKSVNDNLGHKAGDQLLTEVASRIKGCIRESDTVARYSGDEFTLILNDLVSDSIAVTIAGKILETINQPFQILEHQVFCSSSIGISVYPDDGRSPEDLISNADHAMYEVKKEGRNGWHFFTREMQEQSEKRHRLFNKLSSVIARDELDVFYQPIVDLQTGQIVKCEALVRWFDKGRQIPTIDFISLAEETGLINEIDRLVLKKAGAFISSLYLETGITPCLSINLSPRIFSSKDNALTLWFDLMKDLSSRIDITVEITERLLTQNSDQALQVLNQLKALGISIAIDDFGTGYSSLSYLTKFPIDILKIDREFISNIEADTSAETLTDTIISLAKKMSIDVVAEGVETEYQLNYLRQRGCDMGQGYYLGKPQDGDFLKALLTQAEIISAESI